MSTNCQLEAQSQAITDLQAKAEQLAQAKQELQPAFDELLRRAFQKRSERYIQDLNQLRLDFGDTPEAVEESGQVIKQHVRWPSKRRNESRPEHGERKLIGYDRTETLVFERPKLWVRVTT